MTTNTTSGRKYSGQSKEDREAQRRQKFIEAGISVFGDDSYESATVRKLCKAAGLTERYFYESFAGTEALLIAVYSQCIQRIENHITSVLLESGGSTTGIEDLVLKALDAYYQEVEDPRITKIIMLEIVGVSSKLDELNHSSNKKLADLLLTIGRSYFPDLNISDEEGRLLGVSLIGAVRQVTVHWYMEGYQEDRKNIVDATAKIFLTFLSAIGPKEC